MNKAYSYSYSHSHSYSYLIDFVFLTYEIKFSIHLIQHIDDFHGRQVATDTRKTTHIRKQDRHTVKHL